MCNWLLPTTILLTACSPLAGTLPEGATLPDAAGGWDEIAFIAYDDPDTSPVPGWTGLLAESDAWLVPVHVSCFGELTRVEESDAEDLLVEVWGADDYVVWLRYDGRNFIRIGEEPGPCVAQVWSR